jgi:hypothetical protein
VSRGEEIPTSDLETLDTEGRELNDTDEVVVAVVVVVVVVVVVGLDE